MEWYTSFAILIGGICGLIFLGVPVAVAFIAINILGILLFGGGASGLIQIVENSTDLITTFTLAPLPLFVLIGSVFFHAGLAKQTFDALDKVMGRIPGRLSYLAVGGGALFGTLIGSSMANAAMLGSLLIPEMEKRKYKLHMSVGPILGVGGLAVIIPPSTLAVLLAGIASLDVGKVLIAGVLPGLLIAGLLVGLIWLTVKIDPSSAPAYELEQSSQGERLRLFARDGLPIMVIIVAIIGSILGGIATPTESAAFGAVAVLLVAAAKRRLSFGVLFRALRETVIVGGMVFFIVMGSAVFSQLLAFSGASRGFLNWATSFEMSPVMVMMIMILILLILGTMMDQVSILLITVPVFMPLAQSMGYDLVWFSIIMLITVEIGLLTPPFGLLLFVMLGQSPKGTTFGRISFYALPYIGVHLLAVLVILFVPAIALWLPSFL